jgi:hypothetical protein
MCVKCECSGTSLRHNKQSSLSHAVQTAHTCVCAALFQPPGAPPLRWVFINWPLSFLWWKECLCSVLILSVPTDAWRGDNGVDLRKGKWESVSRETLCALATRTWESWSLQGAINTVEWARTACTRQTRREGWVPSRKFRVICSLKFLCGCLGDLLKESKDYQGLGFLWSSLLQFSFYR